MISLAALLQKNQEGFLGTSRTFLTLTALITWVVLTEPETEDLRSTEPVLEATRDEAAPWPLHKAPGPLLGLTLILSVALLSPSAEPR